MAITKKTTSTDRVARSAEVKVWDMAIRLFHWSLVFAFILAFVSAEEWDQIHEFAGYFIGGLLGFRIIWGIVGSKYARFSNFIYKPSTVHNFLHDSLAHKAKRYLGHNPLGGVMVVALMSSLITITASGIAMTSNMFWGVEWVEELHEATANISLVLIVLHVAGVVFASFEHKENLVKSMITGFKSQAMDRSLE